MAPRKPRGNQIPRDNSSGTYFVKNVIRENIRNFPRKMKISSGKVVLLYVEQLPIPRDPEENCDIFTKSHILFAQ